MREEDSRVDILRQLVALEPQSLAADDLRAFSATREGLLQRLRQIERPLTPEERSWVLQVNGANQALIEQIRRKQRQIAQQLSRLKLGGATKSYGPHYGRQLNKKL